MGDLLPKDRACCFACFKGANVSSGTVHGVFVTIMVLTFDNSIYHLLYTVYHMLYIIFYILHSMVLTLRILKSPALKDAATKFYTYPGGRQSGVEASRTQI